YRNTIFPEVPIVFGGVERNSVKDLDFNKNTIGVFLGQNTFKKTIELALSQHPNTQNAIVIVGNGHMENSWFESAQETFQQYQDKLNFSYLKGLSLTELQDEAENIPDNSLVFYFPVLEDKYGRNYLAVDALSSISEVSSAPIYSFWEILIGHGIVGGYLKSFPKHSQITAKVGLKVLSGNSSEILNPLHNEDLNYIFDYQQLKRWSIPESELPDNSEIRFKEYTFWEQHIYRIILISVLILAQSLIIASLLVTRRKSLESQKALKQAEQKYRTVADYTNDWEYWQNPDGSMQWVSPSCERISGYSSDSIIENPSLISAMVNTEDRKVWDDHLCNNIKKIGGNGIRFRIRKPQGEIRWIEHTCQPVIDAQGINIGVRANNRDITERELYKSQTQKLQSELIHVERVSTISTLSYALAHEINQPLTSIRSYAQAALRFMEKDHSEEENIRNALQGIVSDNKRATSIINRLSDLVRKDEIQFEKININFIIEDVLNLLNSELILREVSVKLDLNEKISSVMGDTIQLQQVLLNLLTNGIHAVENQKTDKREITIATKTENEKGLNISICDSGVGIPEDKLKKIFQPFQTTKSKGLGLGLAITKLIIESHDGKIWAENNAIGGATFFISLPCIS
ncbi:MAG: PAS domain S-box protein, partial [Bacteroidales bacterium]|nr:PAS domain S-box protein [Bacteroidales bacterium]